MTLDIIDVIKSDTRNILLKFSSRNLSKLVKFYSILTDMQKTSTYYNKREIFYQSVNIFKNQSTIDRLINRISKKFKIFPQELLISSSLKGLYYGPVNFIMQNHILSNTLLIPDILKVKRLVLKSNIVVIIEKDSFFQSVIKFADKYSKLANIIWVCGKGYPCINTLRFLNLLKIECKVYGMFDYDPYGMHIHQVYKNGSLNNKIYKVENIIRLGVCAKDVFMYKVDEKEMVDLNRMDYRMIHSLMKDSDFAEDALFLKGLKKKMEIEIFVGRGEAFIAEYLMSKLKYD